MQLLVAHQVLIGAAIALAVFFGARQFVLFSRSGAPADLGFAIASAVVAGLLGLYFRSVRAKWREQRNRR